MTDAELRDLDAEVQRRVFGSTDLRRLPVYRDPGSGHWHVGPAHFIESKSFDARADWCYLPKYDHDETGDDFCDVVPHYSTEIQAMWLVIEKVRERYPVEIHLRKPGEFVACYMDDLVQYAESAPLAVCVAALKCLDRTTPAPPVSSATPPTPR